MKNRILSLLALYLVATAGVWSAPVSRRDAKTLAGSFLQSRGHQLKQEQPVYRALRKNNKKTSSAEDEAYYYVFNADGGQGYVIVSGDDRTEQVLGYSDTGSFDASNVPCNLAALLENYAGQIRYLDAIGYEPAQSSRLKAAATPVHYAIPPILTCLWNQGSPYNLKCPAWGSDLCATGCLATAMAQAMYHYKWPAQTIAEIPAYTDGNNHEIPSTPAGSVIDWDNIKDTYNGTDGLNLAEQDAISNLLYWVGQSIEMTYGSSSSAYYYKVSTALHTYFDYDDDIIYEDRSKYTAEQWFEKIYAELEANRPVFYGGQSTGGGHAFILDGCDADGLFHVNWGWGGSSNGYYRIDVLAPGAGAGIGASSTADGYTMGQCAVFNMHKPDGIPAEVRGALLSTFPTQPANYNVDNDAKTFFVSYCNWSGSANNFDMNVAIVDDEGNLKPFSTTRNLSFSINGVSHQTYSLADLSAGTYKIVPVSKLSTAAKWECDYNEDLYYVEVTVAANGTITHTLHPVEDVEVVVNDIACSHKSGEAQKVNATFTNHGDEFNKTIYFYASQDANYMSGDSPESITRTQVVVGKGDTNKATFSFTPDATGTWYLWLGTGKDNILASTTMEIGSEAAYGYSLSETNFKINNLQGGTKFYGLILNGSVTVKNNGTQTFDHAINIELWHNEEGNDYYYQKETVSIPTVIAAGESKVIPFCFTGLDDTHNYWIGAKPAGGASLNSSHYGYHTVANSRIEYNQQGGMTYGAGSTYTAYSTDATVDMRLTTLEKTTLTSARSNTLFCFAADATVLEAFNGRNVVKGTTAEKITLTDGGGAFYAPYSFTAQSISYSRTFATASDGSTNLETIVLPFAPATITADGNAISLSDLYVRQFEGIDTDGKVCLKRVGDMQAGVPYVIGVPEAYAGKAIVFSATNARIAESASFNMIAFNDTYNFEGATYNKTYSSPLVLNASGTALTASSTTLPFHAYFMAQTTDASTAVNMALGEDEVPYTPVETEELSRPTLSAVSLAPARDIDLRAPSVPLIANDPYFQVWCNGDRLNGQATKGWYGETDKPMNGYVRVDGTTYQFMGTTASEETSAAVLLPGAPAWDGCAYTISDTDPDGWYATGNTPTGWNEGSYGPFNNGDYGNWQHTAWTDYETKNLYVRRKFNLSASELAQMDDNVYLRMTYDQDPVVYVNGTLLCSRSGWASSAGTYLLDAIPVSMLREGENLIAVKAGKGGGGQFLDFSVEYQPKATDILLAEQKGQAQVLATQSHYSFTAGGIDLDVTFTNPGRIDDTEKFSTPIDYISYKVTPNDGCDHDVQVYLTLDASAFTSRGAASMTTTLGEQGSMRYVKSRLTAQTASAGTQPDWGYVCLAAPYSNDHQDISFCTNPTVTVKAGVMPKRGVGRIIEGEGQTLLFRDNLCLIKNGTSQQGFAVMGYDYNDRTISQADDEIDVLPPYYTKQGSFESLMADYAADYAANMAAAREWDETIYDDALAAGGKKYAEVASLTYRQTVAANTVALFHDRPLVVGMNVGASQDIPSAEAALSVAPLLALYNPSLLAASVLAQSSVSEELQKMDAQADYLLAAATALRMDGSIDLKGMAASYQSTKVDNNEALTKEIVLLDDDEDADQPAIRKKAPKVPIITDDEESAASLYDRLKQWAEAMATSLADTETNLGSDAAETFDGALYPSNALSGNVYLQAKCIVALAAFAQVAEAVGDADAATSMSATAAQEAKAWIAANRSGNHYKQAANADWGLKYALVYDQILGTNLFGSIMDDETACYLGKVNAYGVPMDARGNIGSVGYAYAAAAMMSDDAGWQAMTDPVWAYVNTTAARLPLNPFYNTETGESYSLDADRSFCASPMAGWLWTKVLAGKTPVVLDEMTDCRHALAMANGQTRDVELRRTFNEHWATFVAPFDIDNVTMQEQFGDDVQVSTISASGLDGVTLTPMTSPAITAGVPVIMKTSRTDTSCFTFKAVEIKDAEPVTEPVEGLRVVGNYGGRISIPATDTDNSYYYIASDYMKRSTGRQFIRGFRAYFEVSADAASPVKAFFEDDGLADGINDLNDLNDLKDSKDLIYNLAGQRVAKSATGVYIVNGRKIIIK